MPTDRYEIEIVAIPEQYLACLRSHESRDRLDDLERRLRRAFADAGLRPAGALQVRIHGDADREDDGHDQTADLEVCLPVAIAEDGWVPDSVGEAVVTVTPAHHAMATTHAGPPETLRDAHEALRRELASVGYTQAGPASETRVTADARATLGRRATDDAESEVDQSAVVTVVCYPYAR